MPDRHFERLRSRLLDGGVSPRYADRLVTELYEHYCDLRNERTSAGDSSFSAGRQARSSLGSDAAILSEVLNRPELRGRWHDLRAALRFARASAGAITIGAYGGAAVARWGLSISLGLVMTTTTLLVLAHAVAIGI